MQKIVFSVLLFGFLQCPVFAQKPTLGINTFYLGQTVLNNKWSLWHEFQHRENSLEEPNRISFVRLALQRELPNSFQVGQGYGFFVRHAQDDGDVDFSLMHEHRIYQQLLHRNSFKKFTFSHRYRVEERFYSKECHVRFRYMLQTNFVINKNTLQKDAFYISGYKELFLNVESGDVFDRARFYAGAGYVFGEQLRMEFGNMFQYSETQSTNYMMIGVFHKIAPSGKRKAPEPVVLQPV